MSDEIEVQKLKKDYPEFFRKTPNELIDLVLSEKTSKRIADICEKNGVNNEQKVEEIAKRISWVLLGKLPSGNLAMALELWVKLTAENAKKVADEANQFITSFLINFKNRGASSLEKKIIKTGVVEKEPKKSPIKDTYREPTE